MVIGQAKGTKRVPYHQNAQFFGIGSTEAKEAAKSSDKVTAEKPDSTVPY